MNVRTDPGDVDVTVSAPSIHVYSELPLSKLHAALPPMSLASPALAQAGWRLTQLLEENDSGPFPAAAWAPNRDKPYRPTCAALLQTPTEVHRVFGNDSAVGAATRGRLLLAHSASATVFSNSCTRYCSLSPAA